MNDQSSGVGAILEKSRLQGVLRGSPTGGLVLEKVMSDEQVQPGEQVLTSGGDQIFPKGLPAGTVTRVSSNPDSFLNIHVKAAANLSRLEEVLVITKKEERTSELLPGETIRAADILSRRLPSVPDKPAEGTVVTSPKAPAVIPETATPAAGALKKLPVAQAETQRPAPSVSSTQGKPLAQTTDTKTGAAHAGATRAQTAPAGAPKVEGISQPSTNPARVKPALEQKLPGNAVKPASGPNAPAAAPAKPPHVAQPEAGPPPDKQQ